MHTYINYIHNIALHCIALHYITWHDVPWHDITLHTYTCMQTGRIHRHTYVHTYIYIYSHTYAHIVDCVDISGSHQRMPNWWHSGDLSGSLHARFAAQCQSSENIYNGNLSRWWCAKVLRSVFCVLTYVCVYIYIYLKKCMYMGMGQYSRPRGPQTLFIFSI